MKNQSYAFVVRVWFEGTSNGRRRDVWRGSIERVGSENREYFSDLDGIARYIHSHIAEERVSPPGKWQLILEYLQNGVIKFWQRLFNRNH